MKKAHNISMLRALQANAGAYFSAWMAGRLRQAPRTSMP
jgi:hypothetical protein